MHYKPAGPNALSLMLTSIILCFLTDYSMAFIDCGI